jgi:hypothetical protein
LIRRHREGRSDKAIQSNRPAALDCRGPKAATLVDAHGNLRVPADYRAIGAAA